jgi:hypothetical protein
MPTAKKSKISDAIRKVKPYLSLKGAGETVKNWRAIREGGHVSRKSIVDHLSDKGKKQVFGSGWWANDRAREVLGRIKRATTVKGK